MKTIISFFILSFLVASAKVSFAQVNNTDDVQLMLGYSKHGSGDMKGIVFSSEYWKNLSRKFSLGVMLRATINSDKHTIIFTNSTAGTVTDASIRFTTAGVQLGPAINLNLINTIKNTFALGLGVFGRYQSASHGSDGYSILYPPNTNYPGALIEYNNSTPQHTLALGGLLQLQYKYSFNNKLYIGAVVAFQTDTNGDAIPQVGLVIGRKFRKD